MKQKDLLLISNLRMNGRETLTNISKNINMPISTIFDKLKMHQKGIIKKHTTLIDFSRLGFTTRAKLTLKVNKSRREELRDYLEKHQNVNSIYKINNGYDYLVEVIFKNMKDMEDFMELLEEKFKTKSTQTYYIIEDIKRESFLSDPQIANLAMA